MPCGNEICGLVSYLFDYMLLYEETIKADKKELPSSCKATETVTMQNAAYICPKKGMIKDQDMLWSQ